MTTHTATRFAPRGADTFRIHLTSTGFEISSVGAHEARRIPVSWSEISKIDAYQRDKFGENTMLVFSLKEGSTVDLNEDLSGWKEVLDQLPRALPGCQPRGDWWRGALSSSGRKNEIHWRTIYYRYSISGMGEKRTSAVST